MEKLMLGYGWIWLDQEPVAKRLELDQAYLDIPNSKIAVRRWLNLRDKSMAIMVFCKFAKVRVLP